MLARKKSVRFIYIKFPSNFKILALLLMMRKITLEVKIDEKYVQILKFSTIYKYQCGALAGDTEDNGSSPPCVIELSAGIARQTENYACSVFSGGFTSYLPNGYSVNLRAIENCIFSIRSIERNMRPILRTVWSVK
jgi:hypothetical protein